jgi:DNA-binding NarL/FixJ family response regulator
VTPGARILLAEGDAPTRAGLRLAIRGADFELVADVARHDAAVRAAIEHRPEVALVAADLPDGGIETIRSLLELDPRLRVIVLSADPAGEELLAAVLAGAAGYLSKDMNPARLPHAIRGVLDGEVALPRRHTDHLLAALRERSVRRLRLTAMTGAGLTDREWEVLQLLADGSSTAEIASRLLISQVTVRRHISTVVGKLGVSDRASAVGLLSRSGD